MKLLKSMSRSMSLIILSGLAAAPSVADENHAREILRNMSDYLAGLETLAFSYDSTLEVVTTDKQILGIAASGKVQIDRPNKLHATRRGGFSDSEMFFDGTTLSMAENQTRVFTVLSIPGSVDVLIDELRDTYGLPLPAADLLTSDAYDALMSEVSDVKDLGSGFVNGHECDHLAFRTPEVDWQIWIAQGENPFPCRYTITTKSLALGPQYSIDVQEWSPNVQLSEEVFEFVASENSTEVDASDAANAFGDLPAHFSIGDNQ